MSSPFALVNASISLTFAFDNEFKYKNIPADKITEIKNTLDLDQDSKQIQNTLTNKEIENMLIDLKSLIFWGSDKFAFCFCK
jgi:hypothetical protein